MRAIVVDEFGLPEGLRVREAAMPRIALAITA